MKRLFILVIFNLLFGCSNEPDVVIYNLDNRAQRTNEVYIVNHGWHTGIIVSAAAITEVIPELADRFGDIKYIEIGWGDKGFYQAKKITFGLSLKAIFWPTESVVHAVAINDDPDAYFINSETIRLCFNDSEINSMLEFIKNSFYHTDEDQVKSLEKGIYGDSQFYKGTGDYYLLNTCNKWTAKGLSSAGLDILPTFKLTAESVMGYLKMDNTVGLHTHACLSAQTQI